MSVRRFDSSKLGKVEKTKQGFIRVPANLTRIGVLEYRDEQGNVTRELRHPDHVFDPESLATLEGVPVTDLHPKEFLNPNNVRDLQVGFVSETPKRDGSFVSARLTIQRSDAISAVLDGKRKEVSLGYTCVPVQESGEWEGQRYDCIQTQIRYDHAAIGPTGWGRAGGEVSLRLDGGAISVVECGEMELQERLDAAEAKAKDLETQVGKLTAERDAVAAALETYKAAERKDARDALESRAREVLGSDAKFEGLSDRQVREAAILKIQPERKLDSLSDDFVAGAFEYLASGVPSGRNDALASVRVVAETPKTDSAPKTGAEIRAEAIAKRNSRWKLNEGTK